jgi:NAD(P)-dependent dehydrogenase (short-subunit alcohol dehydrogenase family)
MYSLALSALAFRRSSSKRRGRPSTTRMSARQSCCSLSLNGTTFPITLGASAHTSTLLTRLRTLGDTLCVRKHSYLDSGGTGMSTRVAVVIGAGSGLGQAVAVRLSAAGLTIVGVDRNEAGLNDLPDRIIREVADAADPAVSGPLMHRIAAEVGPPDILINTIGTFELGDALSVTPTALNELVSVNLGAALWLTQAVVPHMQRKGAGSIVHITARPGLEATAGYAAYGVSKAALAHLVRTLDVELRPSGIRVNAIAPQIIATAKNRELFPSDAVYLPHAESEAPNQSEVFNSLGHSPASHPP